MSLFMDNQHLKNNITFQNEKPILPNSNFFWSFIPGTWAQNSELSLTPPLFHPTGPYPVNLLPQISHFRASQIVFLLFIILPISSFLYSFNRKSWEGSREEIYPYSYHSLKKKLQLSHYLENKTRVLGLCHLKSVPACGRRCDPPGMSTLPKKLWGRMVSRTKTSLEVRPGEPLSSCTILSLARS